MTSQFPDVSQVLRGPALAAEDAVWNHLIHEKEHLADILTDYLNSGVKTVLEIGCGTGLYARILRSRYSIDYQGVDSNGEALAIAQERNPGIQFRNVDFRRLEVIRPTRVDLVCAHAFLKHFALEEWAKLFRKFLSFAPVAQFDMQTASETLNDGSLSFGNNLWVAESLFKYKLLEAGHTIRYAEEVYRSGDRKATIYITEATNS